jgi:endonuclease/exonuclease/phosphatase family metal-dependent hydrolase
MTQPDAAAAAGATSPHLRRVLPAALVATVFLVTVELLRAASPMLDLAAGEVGFLGAAGLALLVFAAPVLVGPLVAALGAGRATIVAVGALVLLRLVAQAAPTLPVIAAGAAVGIGTLVLVVRRAPGAVVGVLLGTFVDLVLRLGAGSWDPIFRPGPWPWVSTVLICGATVALLRFVRLAPGSGRAAVLGPYLALYLMGYGSAPILAAHAGIPLRVAGEALIATAGVGLFLLAVHRPPWLVPGAGIVAGVAIGYWTSGPLALVGIVVAGISAPLLLERALAREGGGYAGGGLAAGLGYLLPVMVYQLHYELEFPFDNRLALVAAAGWLAIAGRAGRPERAPALQNQRVVAVLLVILGLWGALSGSLGPGPDVPESDQSGATVRLMSWNLKYGRHHTDGTVDLESVAATVERVDPDVLLLQEVSRGWPIGGGTDMAEWLSDRLEMPYDWAPAADALFGNALFTRLPLSDVDMERLPFVQGPMQRSYLTATVQLDQGQLHLINAHLQHRTENTPTRLVQSEAVLSAWDGAPHTVIVGDFNFWPSWPERELFDAAGLVSAQDTTGHGGEFTTPTDDPNNRVDWIFGTPDLAFAEFAVLTDAANSDHFPLVVTVELR